jgi:hypothetical protein
MPSDLWDITETRDDDEEGYTSLKIVSHRLPRWQSKSNTAITQGLWRAVTNADWARFIFYSRRVKSFDDNNTVLETSEVYETLASGFPQDFIFPNLQTLEWFPIDPELSAMSVCSFLRD